MSGSLVGSPSWFTVVGEPLEEARRVLEVAVVSAVTHSSCPGRTSPTTVDLATREYAAGSASASSRQPRQGGARLRGPANSGGLSLTRPPRPRGFGSGEGPDGP